MKGGRTSAYIYDYNAANPRRKQDPVSPAHALLQQAIWPRQFQILMFLHRNPGATKRGTCEFMKLPLWKLQSKFTKLSRNGLVTRRNVGHKFSTSRFRFYLTREGEIIAQMVERLEAAIVAPDRLMDWEEE